MRGAPEAVPAERGTPRAPAAPEPHASAPAAGRPRLGFLGVGWIGRMRMEALVRDGAAEVAAVADPAPECVDAALAVAPRAEAVDSLDALLRMPLDGVVVATPSALHADQAVRALEAGLPVFCQKPLGRDEPETRRVVDAARAAGRRLGVDFCYRRTRAMERVRGLVRSGELGRVYAADLVFHNAYGPDKPWFYRRSRAGGGCLMDLGIHLIDLALWTLGEEAVEEVNADLRHAGGPLSPDGESVEDWASVGLRFASGRLARIACSWNLPAGRDAVIEAAFYGTDGGAAMRNVDGSFLDLRAERYDGTRTETLVEPPDAWGGRALADWAAAVAAGGAYDPSIEEAVEVARVLDRAYGR